MKKITKNMTFAELIMNDKKAAEKLADKGLFCGGCPMAQFETIEQGAAAHGIDADELVKELNSKLKNKQK
jgi:hybrid cluster-associated redox disulfide protein